MHKIKLLGLINAYKAKHLRRESLAAPICVPKDQPLKRGESDLNPALSVAHSVISPTLDQLIKLDQFQASLRFSGVLEYNHPHFRLLAPRFDQMFFDEKISRVDLEFLLQQAKPRVLVFTEPVNFADFDRISRFRSLTALDIPNLIFPEDDEIARGLRAQGLKITPVQFKRNLILKALLALIKNNSHLEKLHLGKVFFETPELQDAVLKILATSSSLKELQLMPWTSEVLPKLNSFLARQRQIHSLTIERDDDEYDPSDSFENPKQLPLFNFVSSPHLRKLRVDPLENLSEHDFRALVQGIAANHGLRSIIFHADVEAEGRSNEKHLVDALSQHGQIENLEINQMQVRNLIRVLRSNPNLRSFKCGYKIHGETDPNTWAAPPSPHSIDEEYSEADMRGFRRGEWNSLIQELSNHPHMRDLDLGALEETDLKYIGELFTILSQKLRDGSLPLERLAFNIREGAERGVLNQLHTFLTAIAQVRTLHTLQISGPSEDEKWATPAVIAALAANPNLTHVEIGIQTRELEALRPDLVPELRRPDAITAIHFLEAHPPVETPIEPPTGDKKRPKS